MVAEPIWFGPYRGSSTKEPDLVMKVGSFVSHSAITRNETINDAINQKTHHFLTEQHPDTPFLLIDLDVIAENYFTLLRLLPQRVFEKF
jgi:hypothetical protein